jgi:hypothetical protein
VLGEPNEAALLNAPGAAEGWRHVVAIGDIYDGPEHEALVDDQLAFVRRHLL